MKPKRKKPGRIMWAIPFNIHPKINKEFAKRRGYWKILTSKDLADAESDNGMAPVRVRVIVRV